MFSQLPEMQMFNSTTETTKTRFVFNHTIDKYAYPDLPTAHNPNLILCFYYGGWP